MIAQTIFSVLSQLKKSLNCLVVIVVIELALILVVETVNITLEFSIFALIVAINILFAIDT